MDPPATLSKEQLRMTLKIKRYGALQGVLGLSMAVICIISIGIDNGSLTEDGKRRNFTSSWGYDFTPVMVGLDIAALISALLILGTGFMPVYMEYRGYDTIKRKVVFMVASITNVSLFAPLIAGAAVGVFVMRKSEMWILTMLCLMSVAECLVATAASVFCCMSSWSRRELRDMTGRPCTCIQNENYMKKMEAESRPPAYIADNTQ